MSWQNQYNLNHLTVPESTHTLLPDLEAIERVMEEKRGVNLKAKAKGSTAPAEAKSNPKRKASGGPTGRVPKKSRSEKCCQRCKAHGSPFTMHNTLDCRCYDSSINSGNCRSPKGRRIPEAPLYVIRRALPLSQYDVVLAQW